jgi:hypothetical protein
MGDAQSSNDTERGSTKVVVAECPMSWCQFTAVVEDPETGYEAAYEIQEHVNEDHSEKDMETLNRSVDSDTDQ